MEFSMKWGLSKEGRMSLFVLFRFEPGRELGGKEQWTRVNKLRVDIEVKDRRHMAASS